MKRGVCLSVRPSVRLSVSFCLSVACLDLTREHKSLGSLFRCQKVKGHHANAVTELVERFPTPRTINQ